MNDDPRIDRAVTVLRAGGLVAFPTETVYGLGADATNASAVHRIFLAKERPATNPLIVHVAGVDIARRYASVWPSSAQKIADAFWPGPITLVLPKHLSIVSQVTAGRMTVGLRMPRHPLALRLLERFDGPLAGPSANRSSRISPTTADHVRSELGGTVDFVLDGGPCCVGIESTVLDLTTTPPTILRPGGISRAQIESVIGPVNVFAGVTPATQAAASPGQAEIHYAPVTPAFRFESAEADLLKWSAIARPDHAVALLAIGALSHHLAHVIRVQMPAQPEEYARGFYASLRDADAMNVKAIWVELPPDRDEWVAIRDRIRRATRSSPELSG